MQQYEAVKRALLWQDHLMDPSSWPWILRPAHGIMDMARKSSGSVDSQVRSSCVLELTKSPPFVYLEGNNRIPCLDELAVCSGASVNKSIQLVFWDIQLRLSSRR
jgi:hypothetical protein